MRYRRRRYRRFRKYRRFYRRYKKRNLINNSSRSRASIKSRATFSAPLNIVGGTNYSNVISVNPFFVRGTPGAGQVVASKCYPFSTVDQPLVINFCQLYDEIKIDSVVIKFTVCSPVPSTSFDALRVWTGWDRKGTYSDTFTADKYPTPATVQSLPSAQVVMLSSNTINTFYRYCKASDFFEKFSFIDATQKVGPADLVGVTVQNNRYIDAWPVAGGSLQCFSPTFYFLLETVNYAPTSDLGINIAIEMTTYYTFRNPKYGASSDDSAKRQRKQLVEEGTTVGTRVRIPLEDAIADEDGVEVGVGDRRRLQVAFAAPDVDPEVDPYAISDPKKRRAEFGADDSNVNMTDIPPAAVSAADSYAAFLASKNA